MFQAILPEEEAEVTATVQQEVSHITSNINKVFIQQSVLKYFKSRASQFGHLKYKQGGQRPYLIFVTQGIFKKQFLDQFCQEIIQHLSTSYVSAPLDQFLE